MKKMTLKIKSKSKRVEETKIIFLRKFFAPRKTVPHQMNMKSLAVIYKGYYSWK
jgi:hypothetical protein